MDRRVETLAAVDVKELPKMSLGSTVSTLPKLLSLFGGYADKVIGPEEFTKLRQAVQEVLPKTISQARLSGAISGLTTGIRTREELEWFAQRLAGNIGLLQHGLPMSAQPGVAPNSWNIARIVEIETVVTRRKGWMKKVWFEVLVGPWAGDRVGLITSNKGMKFVGTQIGYSRYIPHLKILHPHEIVGCLVMVYIANPDNPNWEPSVTGYGVRGAQFAHNRDLARGRRKNKCPHEYVPMDCAGCALGLDGCRFALRRYTWVRRICDKCHEEAWHNPWDPQVCCKCNSARLHQIFREYQSERRR